MSGLHLTASTVLYLSDVDMVRRHLLSLYQAFSLLVEQYSGHKGEVSLTVYLVDNSVDDAYHETLKRHLLDLQAPDSLKLEIIKSPANKGYGQAHNQVLHKLFCSTSSKANDYHLLLNPDVYLAERALWEALQIMLADKDLALLSPRINDNYELVPHVAKRYPSIRCLLARYLGKKLWLKQQQAYCYADQQGQSGFDVELAGGCFYFARLAALQKIGGFDPAYFLYFEDFDLCQRLAAEGWRIRYAPVVEIKHEGGGVAAKSLAHQWHFVCSAWRFFNRFGWRW